MTNRIQQVVVYEKASGRVVSSGACQQPQLLETDLLGVIIGTQAEPGESYVSNGTVYKRLAQVNPVHTFNWQTKQWEDLRTLADLKATKNLQINESRLKANRTSFTFNNKQIAADALSRSDIDAMHGIVLLNNEMPVGWQGGWKAMDNTYVAIPDVATWSLFYSAMVAQGQANFAHSQNLKATLAAATTITEVEAIKWLI